MMHLMRGIRRLLIIVAVGAVTPSCGDAVRQGNSSVFLTVDRLTASQGNKPGTSTGTLTSDVITNVTSPAPCSTTSPCPTTFNDIGTAVLSLTPKDVTFRPTTNNQVTINRYHVAYRRADGRNTPGVDVPYGFDGSVTATILGPVTVSFELVRHVAKEEAPLVQLISNPAIISTIADVTFYGTDQVGNAISVTGSMLIDFGNFGD
jgi:hypothetical protein